MTLILTQPPAPPSLSDPANFSANAAAFMAWFNTFADEVNAAETLFAPRHATRAEALAWLAEDPTLSNGALLIAEQLCYVYETGADVISDMPGWKPLGRYVSLRHFPVAADGVTADDASIEEFLTYVAANDVEGFVPGGDYAVQYVRLRDLSGDISVRADPSARFIGLSTLQIAAGSGQSSVTINFPVGTSGVDVMHIASDLTETVLESGTDYTVSGQTLTLLGSSDPLAVGDSIAITSANPMFSLQPSTNYTRSFLWEGGYFDNSARGWSPANGSGSAFNLYFFKQYGFRNASFYGSEDYETARANRVSDTAITPLGCTFGTIEGCYFQGQADNAVYLTGDADAGDVDNGKLHRYAGNYVDRCHVGFSGKRDVRGMSVSDNTFFRTETGIVLTQAGNGVAGGRASIVGNHFIMQARRAILIETANGVTVSANRIQDVGYDLSDAANTELSCIGIHIIDSDYCVISGNTLWFEEWTSQVGTRGIVIAKEFSTSDYNHINGNIISGFDEGIYESANNIGNVAKDNVITGATTAMTPLGNGRWSYVDGNGRKHTQSGTTPFIGSSTPTIYFAGAVNSVGVSYSRQYCNYRREGEILHVWVSVQAAISHTEGAARILRIELDVPWSSVNETNFRGIGSLLYANNIRFKSSPTDAGEMLAVEARSNSTDLQIRDIRNDAVASGYISSDDIDTGDTIRVDAYIAIPLEI